MAAPSSTPPRRPLPLLLPAPQFCARDEAVQPNAFNTDWKWLLASAQQRLTELGEQYNHAAVDVARESLFLSRENDILETLVKTHRLERDIYRRKAERLEEQLARHQGFDLEDLSLNQLLRLKATLLRAVGNADEALARLKGRSMCCVCAALEVDTVLMPCRHAVLCSDCADHASMVRCPVCRDDIASKMQVYYT